MPRDLGANPTDPNNYLAITRTVAMNTDGSYPDQRSAIPFYARATGPSSVPVGAASVTIRNAGGAAGTVMGTTLPSGESVSWSCATAQGLSAIAYDGTGTTLVITAVTNAPVPPDPVFTQDPRGTDPSFTQEYPNGIPAGQVNQGQNR